MRIALIAVIAAGALSFTYAAQAADSPAPKPNTHATDDGRKKDDPDRVICKSPELTGSRLPPKKVCRTKREWDEMTEHARQQIELETSHQGNPQG